MRFASKQKKPHPSDAAREFSPADYFVVASAAFVVVVPVEVGAGVAAA